MAPYIMNDNLKPYVICKNLAKRRP